VPQFFQIYNSRRGPFCARIFPSIQSCHPVRFREACWKWGRGKNDLRVSKGGEGRREYLIEPGGRCLRTFLSSPGCFREAYWKWGRGKTIRRLPKVGEKGVPVILCGLGKK